MLAVLKKKKEEAAEQGVEICIKEDPLSVVIITPIMRRAHQQQFAEEIVFIDSSGSCDQTCSVLTFIFGATKVGGVPLACVLHTAQTEEDYRSAFSAVKEALGPIAFNRKGFPKVIMTDDSAAERNALAAVFPESCLLLCIFHVCQALWRWLWCTSNHIEKEDRSYLMSFFRGVLFAMDTTACEANYESVCSDNRAIKYSYFLDHLARLWDRRKEWALNFRSQIITRGHNTNNLVEASIRIFKDVVLERCKAFNMCALAEFIANVLENYHKRRLLRFSNSRSTSATLLYSSFMMKAKEAYYATKRSILRSCWPRDS
jgi:hypothetical protein